MAGFSRFGYCVFIGDLILRDGVGGNDWWVKAGQGVSLLVSRDCRVENFFKLVVTSFFDAPNREVTGRFVQERRFVLGAIARLESSRFCGERMTRPSE